MQGRTHTHKHTYAYTLAHTYTHTHTHTNTHKYKHMHARTYTVAVYGTAPHTQKQAHSPAGDKQAGMRDHAQLSPRPWS